MNVAGMVIPEDELAIMQREAHDRINFSMGIPAISDWIIIDFEDEEVPVQFVRMAGENGGVFVRSAERGCFYVKDDTVWRRLDK